MGICHSGLPGVQWTYQHSTNRTPQRKGSIMTTATAKKSANDETRCTFTTDKGRRCLLEIHTDAVKHKMVDRTAKEHKPLSAVVPAGFTLAATDVTAGEVIKKASNRKDDKPRDADQKRVDTDVAKNYAKNAAKQRNASHAFDTYTLSQYIVPAKATDTVLDYLRRSVGSGGPVAAQGKVLRYRKGVHGSGNVRVQWAIVDKAPKGTTVSE